MDLYAWTIWNMFGQMRFIQVLSQIIVKKYIYIKKIKSFIKVVSLFLPFKGSLGTLEPHGLWQWIRQ